MKTNTTTLSNNMATNHAQSTSYATTPTQTESRFDMAYFISIRGILKLACLLFSFIAFICLVSTPQCSGNHVFLAVVTWIVMIVQILVIIVFAFGLKTKFPDINFELLDFYVTSHDALYLLIASSVTIHYCRIAGQIAGGAMGILAFLCLFGDALIIFLAQRKEPDANANNNSAQ